MYQITAASRTSV